MRDVIVLLVSVAAASLLLYRRVTRLKIWSATITLASIIGSGLLVLGPILEAAHGRYSLVVMAALCLGAYLFGSAVRHNIAAIDRAAA
jgi:hypothetical protein